MNTLHIEHQGGDGKGRIFEACLLAHVECEWLWPQPSDNVRPVFAVLAATEAQARPFQANLQTGRKAKVARNGELREGVYVEFLKSAGYAFATQRFEGLAVTTAYLTHLFVRDPGMVDTKGIEFIVAPDQPWCDAHAARLPVEAAVAHLKRVRKGKKKGPEAAELASLVPLASLFAAFLDGRTRAPLIPDPRFQVQLLVAALDAELALFPSGERHSTFADSPWGLAEGKQFKATGMERTKMARPIAFKSSHDRFTELLATEVDRYFKHTAA